MKTAHQSTIRPANEEDSLLQTVADDSHGGDDTVAGDVDFVMGSSHIVRFLRRSTEYGKFDILSTALRPVASPNRSSAIADPDREGRWARHVNGNKWDSTRFALRCAGCHTTAVASSTNAFSSVSLDCFVCHGDVPLRHTDKEEPVIPSDENSDPKVVTSICAQCHLRGGSSRSTGLPYANTFVPGDNLFQDYEVNLSAVAIEKHPAVEQHIYQNVRDVVQLGSQEVTCLSCHNIHQMSSDKHQRVARGKICSSCHAMVDETWQLLETITQERRSIAHSNICDY